MYCALLTLLLLCTNPTEVFVSLNRDNGNVYFVKCSCAIWVTILILMLSFVLATLDWDKHVANHVAALLFFIEYHTQDNEL